MISSAPVSEALRWALPAEERHRRARLGGYLLRGRQHQHRPVQQRDLALAGGQLPVGGGLKTVCGSVEPGQEEQRQLRKNEQCVGLITLPPRPRALLCAHTDK